MTINNRVVGIVISENDPNYREMVEWLSVFGFGCIPFSPEHNRVQGGTYFLGECNMKRFRQRFITPETVVREWDA